MTEVDLPDRLKSFMADLPPTERGRIEEKLKLGPRVVRITEHDGTTILEWSKDNPALH
jgi:hypothetical protein